MASSMAASGIVLKDKQLFKQNNYINGEWIKQFQNNKTINVINPATGKHIGIIPNADANDAKKAIHDAAQAFEVWKKTTAHQRAQIVRKWYELMVENADDLATIMTMEQGKPLAEAKGEIMYAAGFLEVFSGEVTRVHGEIIPSTTHETRIALIRQPVGVVAAITPWNFPSAMITRKAGAAIAAGCSVVLKPSELTPYSALALAELGERAGLPKGVFNVITGDAAPIGEVMTSDPLVRKLTFTGSTRVGKMLYKQCADTVKKVSLELGGNAPFIVFDDADVEQAVKGAMLGKYRNAGQTCVSPNRLYVQEGIYDKFATRLVEEVRKLKVGNGLEPGVVIGPLINENAVKKVQMHIQDALAKGGKALVGGQQYAPSSGLSNLFFQPTVITDANDQMEVYKDETFGPASFLFKFKTDEEAIQHANNTIYGLASYFYSSSQKRIWNVMEALEYGMIGVNQGSVSSAWAPFGGIKQSGIGREGSHIGLDDFLVYKTAHFNIGA